MVWIIGVGDSDTKVERSIISCKKRPIRHFTITVSGRTQRGLERTSGCATQTTQRSCQCIMYQWWAHYRAFCKSLLLSLGDIRVVTQRLFDSGTDNRQRNGFTNGATFEN